ncbi:MAG: tetratricopeptide repeat protein [Desulfobacterales bacterium]
MKIKVALCLLLSLALLNCTTTQTINKPTDLSPQQLNDKAVALWNNGKYTDPNLALKYANEAIEKDPNYGRAFYTRGFIYNDLKRYQESIDSFTEALKYDPRIHETYNGRGWVYYTIGDYEKAIKDYTKAIHIKGDYKLALNNRAMAYMKTGQNQKACMDFSKVCVLGDCGNIEHAKKIGKCE